MVHAIDLSACDTLAALHANCFSQNWDVPAWQELLQGGCTGWWIVKEGVRSRAAIGCLLVRQALDEAEIITIMVAPAHQRQGLAVQMLEVGLRELGNAGVTSCFLEVQDDNHPARQCYRKLGFDEVAARKGYYHQPDGSKRDAIVMRKAL